MDKETRPWTQLARQFILIFVSILVIVIWLEGIAIVHTAQNQTLMSGSLRDQAALYGLIIKLRDLGVKIVSMNFSDNSC